MRLNFTPFVDLFSILAVGLLIIMSVTSGTDVARSGDTEGVMIRFFPGVEPPMETRLRISPYYVLNDVEKAPGALPGVVVGEEVAADHVLVWLVGSLEDMEVGFRVTEVVDTGLLGAELDGRIEKRYRETQTRACSQTIGSWRDPVVCVGRDCLRGCE